MSTHKIYLQKSREAINVILEVQKLKQVAQKGSLRINAFHPKKHVKSTKNWGFGPGRKHFLCIKWSGGKKKTLLEIGCQAYFIPYTSLASSHQGLGFESLPYYILKEGR